MTIEIRPLRAQDYQAWKRLWEAYKDFYRASVSDAVDNATWQRLLAADAIQGFGAFVDG